MNAAGSSLKDALAEMRVCRTSSLCSPSRTSAKRDSCMQDRSCGDATGQDLEHPGVLAVIGIGTEPVSLHDLPLTCNTTALHPEARLLDLSSSLAVQQNHAAMIAPPTWLSTPRRQSGRRRSRSRRPCPVQPPLHA